MLKRHKPLLPCLLLSLPCALASAGQAPLDVRTAPTLVREIRQDSTSVELVARDYRARYEGGRLHFAPSAPGTDAPSGLGFKLEAIERGEQIVFEPRIAPNPRVEGEALLVDWPGFQERYDPRIGGLEQSFVFEGPLPGTGELRVRLRLDSELAPIHASSEFVTFAHAGSSTVSIQGVLGIDALGREARGELRLDGDALELVLPAAFVGGAAFPLVLDPLIVPLSAIYTGDDVFDPDVAWEAKSGYSVVTWGELDLDFDANYLWAAVLSETGDLIGASTLFGGYPAQPPTRPAICSVTSAGACLLVQQYGTDHDASLVVISYDPTNLHTLGDLEVIKTPWCTGFDVGGEATTEAKDACVVWTTHSAAGGEVNAQFVSVTEDLQVQLGESLLLDDASSGAGAYPRISQSNGYPGKWLVVWERYPLGGSPAQPAFRTIDHAGALGPVGLTTDTGNRPSCDGDGEHFLIAYHRKSAFGVHEIVGELYDVAGPTALLRKQILVQDQFELLEPQVAILLNESTFHSAYAVAWEERMSTGSLETSRYRVFTEPGLDALGPRTHVGSDTFLGQRIASRFAADFDPWVTPGIFVLALRSPLGIMRALGSK